MVEAYAVARSATAEVLRSSGECLDRDASEGLEFEYLQRAIGLDNNCYAGIEWNVEIVKIGQEKGRKILQGDLNRAIALPDNKLQCVFAYTVLEHLLNPCHFIRESYRCLKPGGPRLSPDPAGQSAGIRGAPARHRA